MHLACILSKKKKKVVTSIAQPVGKQSIGWLEFEPGRTGFANFIDEWSQCDFYFTNLGVILEYLESSIRLSST